MAYTFGAATTNMISWSANKTSLWSTNRASLVSCWVYPTTLTATRVIFAAGLVWRLEIDTTTSSCRFTTDCVTTKGVYTFPAGLALNTWTFICMIFNCASPGPTIQIDAWTATDAGPITKQTVTNVTAGVGTFNTSNLVLQVGNVSTPTLAFQGDIANVCAIADVGSSVPGILGFLADGTTSQGELDVVTNNFVAPLWRGDVSRIAWAGSQALNQKGSSPYSGLQVIAPLEDHLWSVKPSSNQGVIQATLAGATRSARRSPRPFNMVNDTPMFIHRTNVPQGVA